MKISRHWVIFLSALVMSACKQADTSILDQGVIYCSEGSPETFNPQLVTSATTLDAVSRQLFNRLLEFDPVDNSLQPSLAEYWMVSQDGLTYTFKIRSGVQFQTTRNFIPSRELNADDVIFSFNRWYDVDHPYHQVNGGIYPYFDSMQLAENIKAITRVSSRVVRFTLYKKDHDFIQHFASHYTPIHSAEYAEQLLTAETPELLDSQPVGTGPFKLTEYHKDAFIRFKQHSSYWEGTDYIQNLVFDITSQSSLRLAKLITKECDLIAYPASSEMQVLSNAKNISVQAKTANNVGFWAFNTLKAPFDNPKVRYALAAAIDKETILRAVYYGTAIKANSILPPNSWAYNPNAELPQYDPALARKLLKEAGIPDGFKMNIWAMPIERPYNPNAHKMAELISSNLAEVGIEANIVSYEWNTFRRLLSEQRHDSVLIGWAADTPSPDNFLSPIFSCASAIVGSNRSAWCNTDFDEILYTAAQTEDKNERKALYIQAQKILQNEMPVVPIAHSTHYLAKLDNVHNVHFYPNTSIGFSKVEKNK
ncbi:ABC transporter substrate-binding protein [Algibacillus agarilyticus]|uniref:ABC transporter substrate-binding protein n=1 Tax=Algibacillus agarilyticus TaxID=2234133 RepID=UPI000DD080EA|nr:ABC transporter substrate-binding protein [Algibacillus agarilyticus]